MGEGVAMDEWTRQRTCAECGKPFSLRDHGHLGAQSAAQSIEMGSLDPDNVPDVVAKCPACCGVSGINEAEAIAAALQIRQDMDRSSSRERFAFARLAGALTAIFSVAALIMMHRYMQLRQGEYAAGRVYAAVMVLSLILGVVIYVWAFIQSRKLKR